MRKIYAAADLFRPSLGLLFNGLTHMADAGGPDDTLNYYPPGMTQARRDEMNEMNLRSAVEWEVQKISLQANNDAAIWNNQMLAMSLEDQEQLVELLIELTKYVGQGGGPGVMGPALSLGASAGCTGACAQQAAADAYNSWWGVNGPMQAEMDADGMLSEQFQPRPEVMPHEPWLKTR